MNSYIKKLFTFSKIRNILKKYRKRDFNFPNPKTSAITSQVVH